MLRSNFNTIFAGKLSQILPIQYQSLRWKRKPRKPFWIGTAKSKKFIIYEQPVLPPEEKAELKRLDANYRTIMKSIRHYYENMAIRENASKSSIGLVTQEEIDASLKLNEQWNAECALMRSKRMEQEAEEHKEVVKKVLENREIREKILQEKVEHLVRIEKEQSKTFITRENLDEKIEECLNSHTNYNYAIDLQGNMYTGFEAEMKKITKEAQEQVQQN